MMTKTNKISFKSHHPLYYHQTNSLKNTFLDTLFPLELREIKIQEFINLSQVDMSVKEYSLKFTPLLKHSPTIVTYSSTMMNKFVKCRLAILISSMEISPLMVHAKQI